MTAPQPPDDGEERRLGPGGWFTIAVLLAFLAWAAWYGVHVWNRLAGVQISPLGWVFMGLGAFFTILVGGGLMALVFYSSRHHYDE